jgi:hypothetical protein
LKFALILCGQLLPQTDFASHCPNGERITGKTDAKGQAESKCPWITFKWEGVALATRIDSSKAEARCVDYILRRK